MGKTPFTTQPRWSREPTELRYQGQIRLDHGVDLIESDREPTNGFVLPGAEHVEILTPQSRPTGEVRTLSGPMPLP
jgi:hypothetical protein